MFTPYTNDLDGTVFINEEAAPELWRQGVQGKVRRYLAGRHDLPYMPRYAKAEFRHLARRSITNWLPLVSGTFVKGLFVDGYRAAKAKDNATAWDYWQANGLDARQTVAHRGALEYGVSYVLVLPGSPKPVIKPLDPTKSVAFYEEDDAEWPVYGLNITGRTQDGARLFELYDDTNAYKGQQKGGECEILSVEAHGLGVCPFVRFRDRLDGPIFGIIYPLIPVQDRINEAVFSLLVALQYASFRQRWATGLAIPVDEDPFLPNPPNAGADFDPVPNPNFGKPAETFQAAVDRLWVTDSPDAKFGDFSQTDVTGHLATYDAAVKTLAALGEISPHILIGDLVNISADALAAINEATQAKKEEFQIIFGEAWEQVLRLASKADGNTTDANDTSASVRWRDTEARSFERVVTGLGLMVQQLGVPAQATWDRIPGVDQADVQRWETMAQTNDGMKVLADALNRSSASPALAPNAHNPFPPDRQTSGDPADPNNQQP
jgi:hypothetical protein